MILFGVGAQKVLEKLKNWHIKTEIRYTYAIEWVGCLFFGIDIGKLRIPLPMLVEGIDCRHRYMNNAIAYASFRSLKSESGKSQSGKSHSSKSHSGKPHSRTPRSSKSQSCTYYGVGMKGMQREAGQRRRGTDEKNRRGYLW